MWEFFGISTKDDKSHNMKQLETLMSVYASPTWGLIRTGAAGMSRSAEIRREERPHFMVKAGVSCSSFEIRTTTSKDVIRRKPIIVLHPFS